jgi:carboxyl-terminal processing protease
LRALVFALVYCFLAGPVLAQSLPTPSKPTIAFVLEAIHDRALTAFSTESIALEGLKGLATIDPALDVTIVDHRLRLRYRTHALASYALPAADDKGGWTFLIDQATREATRHSAALGKIDNDLLTETLIDGFLSKLDIFSHYAGPAEARERRASRTGFDGIGVRFEGTKEGVSLTQVMPDSPAQQARLRVGDILIAIDEIGLKGLDQDVISQKLRGPIGSPVKLTLRHSDGTPFAVTLHRTLIVPPSVTVTSKDAITTIAIASFNQNTAAGVIEALKTARGLPGFKGIILDLRGNSGGLLDQAITVADQFIERGHLLATRGRHPDAAQSQEARAGDPGESLPVVALIDGHTASAAEILAADLQDSGRAVLVGTNSFGKGAIQTVLDLPTDGEMTLTWSRFFAPSGYALHGLGVLPSICTVPDAKATDDRPLAGGRAASAGFFEAWREVKPDDMPQRIKLRRHCPAGDHADDKGDLAIARHLLNDPTLFARALAVAAPVTSSLRLLPPLSFKKTQ